MSNFIYHLVCWLIHSGIFISFKFYTLSSYNVQVSYSPRIHLVYRSMQIDVQIFRREKKRKNKYQSQTNQYRKNAGGEKQRAYMEKYLLLWVSGSVLNYCYILLPFRVSICMEERINFNLLVTNVFRKNFLFCIVSMHVIVLSFVYHLN